MTSVDLKPGDVLLFGGNSVLSRLIRLFDGSEVSHAALWTGEAPADVVEVTGSGVHTAVLSASLSDLHNDFVVVKRLAAPPPSEFVGNVVKRAHHYLENRERYGYEQIVLLAILGLTRKLPFGWRLRALMRHICDHATASVLETLRAGKSTPMICSELVFRCYKEASGDQPGAPQIVLSSEYPRPLPSSRSESMPSRVTGDTLLDWAFSRPAPSADLESMDAGLADGSFRPASQPEELHQLAATFLDETAKGEDGTKSVDHDDELLRSIERFARVLASGSSPNREESFERGGALVPRLDREASLAALADMAAEFVTPGDLLRSPSLVEQTRIKSDGVAIVEQLELALSTYDWQRAQRLCDNFITRLKQRQQPFPEAPAKRVLNLLRRKRKFEWVRHVADALIRSGSTMPTVRRHYAQALIDSGDLTAARAVLGELVREAANDEVELAEAEGLMGRVLKQIYVDNATAGRPGNAQSLREALAWYRKAYERNRTKNLWHGINVVAIVMRAARDQLGIEGVAFAQTVARDVLDVIEAKPWEKLDCWDFATAAEACVALEQWTEARDWLDDFLRLEHGADAFEVASTLRGFSEVWQLGDDRGADLVVVLKAALLSRENGRCELGTREVERAQTIRELPEDAREKTFGRASAIPVLWLMEGIRCSGSVGRVDKRFGGPVGSGFLVRGADFFPPAVVAPDEVLFLTNSHVVGASSPGALGWQEAVVCFSRDRSEVTSKVAGIVWESPQSALDATFIRLAERIEVPPLELNLSPEKPLFIEGKPRRLYVIGHPSGGPKSVSFEDNLQVGWGHPFVHYRTPTEPGSSGSPVFDDQWRVLALHHAGSVRMPRLDGHDGTYEANEGIWIRAIAEAINSAITGRAMPPAGKPSAKTTQREGIFISYSHKDREFLQSLRTHLAPYKATIESLWDDGDIEPGRDWRKEIQGAIARSRIAVLLVSPDFLASDFVTTEELPRILKAAQADGLAVFWIPIRFSGVRATSLGTLQSAHDPAKPLRDLPPAKRDKAWAAIAERLATALGTSAGKVKN